MITNVTFKNCSFEVSIIKAVVFVIINAAIAIAVFLVTLVGLFFFGIILFW